MQDLPGKYVHVWQLAYALIVMLQNKHVYVTAVNKLRNAPITESHTPKFHLKNARNK
jgi:hypothetical protein